MRCSLQEANHSGMDHPRSSPRIGVFPTANRDSVQQLFQQSSDQNLIEHNHHLPIHINKILFKMDPIDLLNLMDDDDDLLAASQINLQIISAIRSSRGTTSQDDTASESHGSESEVRDSESEECGSESDDHCSKSEKRGPQPEGSGSESEESCSESEESSSESEKCYSDSERRSPTLEKRRFQIQESCSKSDENGFKSCSKSKGKKSRIQI
ncbi:hypothetical protein PGT21_021642 [Puccinia graminis f. sp. tritici]|uniref:Uncharacterized protein n=1 Tax=Puccinia graminis f. sp. tritici TaxID=56615 RepID=A0A5B0RL44_PUCGR|nr:hypothetical protein PGT21_021642 [Puccinia graminis f. sp. tritici]KAA1125434.1 hypothetical protein PGTUg99_010731 [Puccinia graminis f. sp. tritici]